MENGNEEGEENSSDKHGLEKERKTKEKEKHIRFTCRITVEYE